MSYHMNFKGIDCKSLRPCQICMNFQYNANAMGFLENLKETVFFSFAFLSELKAAYSVTMNIFRKKKYFLFKSFAKVE